MAKLPLMEGWLAAGLLIAALAFPASAASELVLRDGLNGYAGTADASLYQDRTSNSNGGNAFLYSGVTMTGFLRRTLIKFKLPPVEALLPAAEITSGTLTLTIDRSRPETTTYTLHRVLADWGEGTADAGDPGGFGAQANPGDATWLSRFFGTTLWNAAGGDYTTTPSATLLVSSTLGPVTFQSPGITADLQVWLEHPDQNFGWILIGHESTIFNARRFDSREGPAATRPTLTLGWKELPSAAQSPWLRFR